MKIWSGKRDSPTGRHSVAGPSRGRIDTTVLCFSLRDF